MYTPTHAKPAPGHSRAMRAASLFLAAACSFFFALDSSFLCCTMDWESLSSLFCRLDMLVAAVAG